MRALARVGIVVPGLRVRTSMGYVFRVVAALPGGMRIAWEPFAEPIYDCDICQLLIPGYEFLEIVEP